MANETDFATWVSLLGFNGKQVSQAGEKIGMKTTTSSMSALGKRELTLQDRLAMAAVLADLPPFDPTNADYIKAIGVLKKVIDDEIERRSTSTADPVPGISDAGE